MSLDEHLSPTTDRRTDDGISFDPATGSLRLGALEAALDPGSSNTDVLRSYVDLTARGRGQRVSGLDEVRQDDIDALAAALDLEAGDLADVIESVLGTSPADAVRLIARLRESRVLGGITRAALGAVVAGALASGCASPSTSGTEAKPAAATVQATDQSQGQDQVVTDADGNPIVEDERGVGLIPPATLDAEEPGDDGVVLIPPATIDRPQPD